ncbi:hypothetical protein GCM10023091_22740 [Ravibacter arvi]|uniref:Phosphatidylinositol diacylglycerol-lyase n=1 Tax=Ravibacter arvi TaxID=2051041 RepID=A0ABP8LZR0_9BACT
MKYWDNTVCLSVEGGLTLVRGSYTVEDFSITGGEDPDHHIRSGMTVNFGSDGEMSFEIGRKGSSDNAKWFSNRIMPSQNTFNDAPGKLNFAFIGTLRLVVTGESIGGLELECTFPGFALAQGHSGLNNNWWLGGKTLTYTPSSGPYAVGKGTLPGGSEVTLGFANAAFSAYTFYVTPVSLINTAAWMKHLPDHRRLDEIVLPGSHDAGMSECSHCMPFGFAVPYTQTQNLSIAKQLEAGSRYFDIRVDYDYNELVTYHRTGGNGCNGQNLKSVMDEASSFLGSTPTETVIFKVSHIRQYKEHDAADTKRRINELLNAYDNLLLKKTGDLPANLAEAPVQKLRGKLVMVFDYPEYIDPASGRWRYQDGSAASDANLTVFDEYADTDDYNTMASKELELWRTHGGLGKGYLFLLSWTLTSGKPPLTSPIYDLARVANTALPTVLKQSIDGAHYAKPNVVYIDYVEERVNRSIILWNFS